MVLLGASREADRSLLDEHVPIWRRHVDSARLGTNSIERVFCLQLAAAAQDVGHLAGVGAYVDHNKNRCRKVSRKPLAKLAQRMHTARRGAYNDDVAMRHGQ